MNFLCVEGETIEDTDRTDAWEYCIRQGYILVGKTQTYNYVDEWKSRYIS